MWRVFVGDWYNGMKFANSLLEKTKKETRRVIIITLLPIRWTRKVVGLGYRGVKWAILRQTCIIILNRETTMNDWFWETILSETLFIIINIYVVWKNSARITLTHATHCDSKLYLVGILNWNIFRSTVVRSSVIKNNPEIATTTKPPDKIFDIIVLSIVVFLKSSACNTNLDI